MRTLLRLVAPLAVATLVVGAAAVPAQASSVTLAYGHVDVFDISYASSTLTLQVFADTNTAHPGLHDPADVVFEVPPTTQVTVPPGSGWDDLCIDDAAWVLPQSQVSGVLWAGWNTHGVATGQVDGNEVTVELIDVDGPDGSDGFCVFAASGGSVTQVYLDSTSGPDSFTIRASSHGHPNWGFDNPGTYEVTVAVTATVAGTPVSTGSHTYTFEVYDQ